MTEQQASDREQASARDAARDALVRTVIGVGLELALLLAVSAVLSRRWVLELARQRFENWRTRGEREHAAALVQLHQDISRFEHGAAMPPPPPDHGMYGGLI